MKKCTRCNEEKNELEFGKKKNGLNSQCKKCCYEKRKEYLNIPEKRERENFLQKERIKNHKKEYDEWRKKYREKNKQKIKEWRREYHLKNIEKELAYQKKWRQENKEKFKEAWKRSVKKYPDRIKARKLLNHAIELGYMTKKTECEKCRSIERIEAHHPDYNKPLEVIWLCKKCHTKEHY